MTLSNAGVRRWNRGAAAAGLLGAAAASTPAHVRAICLASESALRWSFPANGATNVATNADLFISGEVGGLPTLDGVPLRRLAGSSFDLGELAPNTTYEVRWATAVIAFTTGDGEIAGTAPALLSNDVLLTRQRTYETNCPLVEPQGCFDTGPPTTVRWDAGFARVWLIDKLHCDGRTTTLVWPSECGVPVLQDEDNVVCASVRGSNGAGLSDATDVVCSVPNARLGSSPRSSGCIGDWPPADVATVFGPDGVTVASLSGPVPASIGPSQPRGRAMVGDCSFTGTRPSGDWGALGWAGLVALVARARRARRSRAQRILHNASRSSRSGVA